MDEWIYEFLYRGFPPSTTEGAWHVIIADQYGKQTVLNMTQAAEEGWALPEIIEGINANTMIEVEALRAENAALNSELEKFNAQMQELISNQQSGGENAEQER